MGSDNHQKSKIEVRISKINKVLNSNFNTDDIIKILSDLNFTIEESGQDEIIVEVPSFRNDIKIEEDLIEEFIRIYGYNNIKSQAIDFKQYNKIDLVNNSNLNKLRYNMCNIGLSEIISWSFVDSSLAKYFTEINQSLLISNAISEEMDCMRPSLLIGLIQAVKRIRQEVLRIYLYLKLAVYLKILMLCLSLWLFLLLEWVKTAQEIIINLSVILILWILNLT